MQYAEIAVNVPVGVNATFTYFIPSNVVVTIGPVSYTHLTLPTNREV